MAFQVTFNRNKFSSKKPKSSQAKGGGGGCFLVVFGAIFALFGVGFLIPFFVMPLLQIVAAQQWVATECQVISSSVKTHSDDDGSTYSVEVQYNYDVNGRTLKGDRYHFMTGSSSGYDGKKDVVDNLPAGKNFTCYYDPENPAASVVERGFTWELLIGIIPLIFILVGVGIIWAGLRSGSSAEKSSQFNKRRSRSDITANSSGGRITQVKSKPQSSPKARFIGMLIFSTFWNSIVGIFVYQIAKSWLSGTAMWFETIFISFFVIVGVLTIFGVVYAFLALFNPVLTLRVEPAAVPLGGKVRVSWMLKGNLSKLKQVRVTLSGKEAATYTRGTDTHTDRHTFYEEVCLTLRQRHQFATGSVEVKIPKESMHSFSSANNKITWEITFSGEIPRWPDVDETYNLEVLPLPKSDFPSEAL